MMGNRPDLPPVRITRASFRQADLERIFRAAKKSGSMVKIDPLTLAVTVFAMPGNGTYLQSGFAAGGPESCDEEVEEIRL